MSLEDEDEDDMAELFSFGAEDGETADADTLDKGFGASEEKGTTATRGRSSSDDSLIEMIESEGVKGFVSGGALLEDHDSETQDILNWLDTEDNTSTDVVAHRLIVRDDDTSEAPPSSPSVVEPTVVVLPPVFGTLREALESKESTSEQIRQLALTEPSISKELRAELYCRLLCNKSSEETNISSLADSFEQWTLGETSVEVTDPTVGAVQDWTKAQACTLSEQFGCEADDLTKLLMYQLRSNGTERDPLLPAVTATLLSLGLPLSACSVLLHQVIASYMPLLHLPPTERWEASLSMHSEFYLLAVYHLPLLVFHLDRYLPGWHWARPTDDGDGADLETTQKCRNLKTQGQLPASWLLSHFAGECDGTFYLSCDEVLAIWDQTFVRKDSALRFFLTLALLEQAADVLLLLTGEELKEKFESALKVRDGSNQSFTSWVTRAEVLRGSTPDSVVSRLQNAEDAAVQHTLKVRQERAEKELKAKMEAEALAHRLAQEKKAEEARDRLNRARLIAFYRKHMPDKEGNVDTILTNYAGRLDVLEKKLKGKYGEGFNPAYKPKQEVEVARETFNLLATMNTGFGGFRLKEKDDEAESDEQAQSTEQVSTSVLASEVLPIFCWSKEAALARGVRHRRIEGQKYLKYCLVDSRTEAAVLEQGRFPTAMNLSPETMMDPEKLKDAEERFESLRGAAHLVIIGDGFSALPTLYNYKLNARMEELIQEDQSRMQVCALFFVKRGFPFVSILDGGFAACYSWLVREGPQHGLSASEVLVDFVPDGSLFGQLETFHNASGAEKAQRRMQALLDKSLTVVAKRAQQLENFANELDSAEPSAAGFRSLFNRGTSNATKAAANTVSESSPQKELKEGEGLKSFFAGIGRSFDDERKKHGEGGATQATAGISSDQNEADSDSSPPSNSDYVGKFDAKPVNPSVNAFTNLWRRGHTNPTVASKSTDKVEADRTTANGSSDTTKGIGVFLKRNPFVRRPGSGGASSAVKSSSSQADTAAMSSDDEKGEVDAARSQDEVVSFSNPISDAEEEVVFEMGELMETADSAQLATATSEPTSKAEVEQV